VRQISVVGYRLGATLAAMAAARGLGVRDLVLWDPAVRGKSYVRELRRLEKSRYELTRQGPRVSPHELMGYPFSAERCADLEGLDMLHLGQLSAQRVHLFASEQRAEYGELANHVKDGAGNPPSFQFVPDEANTGLEEVLLSTRILQAMAARVAEQAA
jgi:pimeloyl-ACP methyl ester carboxylesterase